MRLSLIVSIVMLRPTLVMSAQSIGAPPSIPPANARAQSVGTLPVQRAQPSKVALTIEGGGTLGVYEAGLTWALVEVFRQRHAVRGAAPSAHSSVTATPLDSLPDLQLIASAGASAGSINSLLASVRWCATDSAQLPDQSPFWATWVSTGIPQLLPTRGDSGWVESSLFSRRHFDAFVLDTLGVIWRAQHSDQACAVPFGATITRWNRDSVPVSGDVHARNQRYASAVLIGGSAKFGDLPSVRRPVEDAIKFSQLGSFVELPSLNGAVELADVEELVKASSGYPLAFEPHDVRYCEPPRAPNAPIRQCARAEAMVTRFVDGGVFDNGPLLLGYSLARAGQPGMQLDEMYMLYVTPDHRRHTKGLSDVYEHLNASTSAPEARGFDVAAGLVDNFIPSARQYELQIAARLLPSEQRYEKSLGGVDRLIGKVRGDLAEERARHDTTRAVLADTRSAAYALQRLADTLQHVRDSLGQLVSVCRMTLPACGSAAKADSDLALAILPPMATHLPPNVASGAQGSPSAVASANDLESRAPYDSLLLVTTRFHPLAGSWINGFGGLLGRPLREYDFYVGVYDGLALLARRVWCRGDTTTTCFQTSLDALIASPPMPLDARGRRMMRWLYDAEFETQTREALRESVDTLSFHDRVLIAVASAMASHMRRDSLPSNACAAGGILEQMECKEGIASFFGSLQDNPAVKELTQNASGREICQRGASLTEDCFVDDRFAAFVNATVPALNELIGEMLARMDATTPGDGRTRQAVTLANALYFSTNERGRSGTDLGSISLPAYPSRGAALMRAFPSSVGTVAGVGSIYGEWAARAHFPAAVAIGAAVRLYQLRNVTIDRTGTTRSFFLVPSLRLEYKADGAFAPWVSSLGLIDAGYWFALGGGQGTTTEQPISIGLTASLLAEKIRVSVYKRPGDIEIRGKRPGLLVTIGAGDTNGLLYWVGRLIHP